LEEFRKEIDVSPGAMARKVMVETRPEEVFIPGEGIPPWKVILPSTFE